MDWLVFLSVYSPLNLASCLCFFLRCLCRLFQWGIGICEPLLRVFVIFGRWRSFCGFTKTNVPATVLFANCSNLDFWDLTYFSFKFRKLNIVFYILKILQWGFLFCLTFVHGTRSKLSAKVGVSVWVRDNIDEMAWPYRCLQLYLHSNMSWRCK